MPLKNITSVNKQQKKPNQEMQLKLKLKQVKTLQQMKRPRALQKVMKQARPEVMTTKKLQPKDQQSTSKRLS